MTGKRKAAMLLTNLDGKTVAELLKGLPQEDIQDIAMELMQLDRADESSATKEGTKVAREFCQSIQQQHQRFNLKGFFNEMLVNIVGKAKAEEIRSQIRKATEKRDPFDVIRSASRDELVLALSEEHPQTIAVVLSEMEPRKSQEVLALLSEESRLLAVRKMTNLEALTSGVKERMATMVSEKLKSFKGEKLAEKPERNLRKVALILSGMEEDLRNRLLDEIKNHDEEAGAKVRNLMVTWDDIPSIADRSLQEALRSVESSKLAVAIYGADEEIVQKIRANISERAAAMLDEEISLMQEPLKKEILDAREQVVEPLREANEQGTLRFIGR